MAHPVTLKSRMVEKVAVFDTTLRDGEQAAGTRLGSREKLIIARQLAEADAWTSSRRVIRHRRRRFEAVAPSAREIEGPVDLRARAAVPGSIEACGKALAGPCPCRAFIPGIGVSDIHILGKFSRREIRQDVARKKATILAMAVDAVQTGARLSAADVEFYAEDSGRATAALSVRDARSGIDAGATVVNIPDTTGYTVPEQYGALIRGMRENVPNIGRAVISVHCHDDLGPGGGQYARRHSEWRAPGGRDDQRDRRTGRKRGPRRGRDGHAHARGLFRRGHRHRRAGILRTSRLVADMLGMPVPANKAVVGRMRFAQLGHPRRWIFEGSRNLRDHAAGGRGRTGKPCGADRPHRTARDFATGLRSWAIALLKAELDQTYQRFLAVADKKQEVFDEDLVAISTMRCIRAGDLPARISAHLQRHFGDPDGYGEGARER